MRLRLATETTSFETKHFSPDCFLAGSCRKSFDAEEQAHNMLQAVAGMAGASALASEGKAWRSRLNDPGGCLHQLPSETGVLEGKTSSPCLRKELSPLRAKSWF